MGFLLLPFYVHGQQGLDTLSLETIFYEPLLPGERPDMVDFSPDGSVIYFEEQHPDSSEEHLYQIAADGSDKQSAPDEFQRGYSLSPDGEYIMYSQNGNIWLADNDFGNKRKVVDSKKREYGAEWSPNSEKIAYSQDGDVWILDIETSQLKQVTEQQDEEPGYSVNSWAGNNRLILSQYDNSDAETYYFPEYVHDEVRPGETQRGIPTQIFSVANLDSSTVTKLSKNKGANSTDVSSSGRYLAIDKTDAPMKQRTIEVYDLESGNDTTVVFEDSTDGWIHERGIAFAPEGDRLMIQSEKDGWNHIYTINPDGSDLTRLTDGEFEVPWAEWTDEHSIIFASTEEDPGERHLYTIDTQSGDIHQLTSEEGFRQSFDMSDNHRYLVYEHSYFNEPFELYALDLENPDNETKLSNTVPDRFNKIGWQKEDYVQFTARDGETKLSMSILEPTEIQNGQSHPVVVFVHGAGSLQNVYKGWSNSYWREYMFHQYLNEQGYYVIEVDYRHSTGYGRDFREDVTDWMGKYETNDIVDGLDYLAEHYPEADTSNVGIYGGSYGGFMALYATSVEPDYFDAAAALRAVTNWENYYNTNPWYTLPRLGTPEQDSTHYERSSPISYVDDLEQPVLILHGLIDDNVGFQDAAQYIDELIQAGDKEFDMMMYPTERHSFQDPDAWFDEYTRIYEFFEAELK